MHTIESTDLDLQIFYSDKNADGYACGKIDPCLAFFSTELW